MALSVSAVSPGRAVTSGPSVPATAMYACTDANSINAIGSKYLTADDYKLASAVAGRTIAPDANGYLGLGELTNELGLIAAGRMSGSIPAGANVTADYFKSFAANVGVNPEVYQYIAQRDASATSAGVNYIA